MKRTERLSGMIAAVFTPFDGRGDVSLSVIDAYADWIASTAIQGVFVCGTTGEYSSMTTDERKSVFERWITATRGRYIVIAHVGSNCQKESIDLAMHARQCGADAIASIAPSFFKPASVTDMVDYFAPIANAAPQLPFYFYNMPSMTGVWLAVDKFLSEGIKKIPNLAGTKFTHNNLMEMGACINLDNKRFEVLHGYDEILISGIAMGAVAGVGSTYNYIPKVYDGIFNAMKKGDLEAARKLQMESIKVVEVIIKHGGGVRGGKAVMDLIGVPCGDCRLPISPFGDAERTALKADLENIGFFTM